MELKVNINQLNQFTKLLAQVIQPNVCIQISGGIGFGKTTFTKSLFHVFGVTERVTSPTFALIKSYDVTGFKLIHIDAYRNESKNEIGLEEYLQGSYIIVVEWPEFARSDIKRLECEIINIEIDYLDEENRIYKIENKKVEHLLHEITLD